MISKLLNTRLDPQSVFQAIAEVLRQFVDLDRASLTLFDVERDQFEIVAFGLARKNGTGPGLRDRARREQDGEGLRLSRALPGNARAGDGYGAAWRGSAFAASASEAG